MDSDFQDVFSYLNLNSKTLYFLIIIIKIMFISGKNLLHEVYIE